MSSIFEALQQAELERTGFIASGQGLPASEVIRAREQHRKRGGEVSDRLQTSSRIHSAIPADSRLIASTQPSCFGAEKFRFLALQLRQVQQRRQLKKLLVTSTVPQEGKSFVSLNLAVTLAREREQKILLLDGDLRRPVLNTNLGLESHPGLHEWLRRDVPLMNAIHHIEDLGFWLLPAGDPANSSAEGMPSARVVDALDELCLLFDWIIIDSPPLMPLTDASVWCRVVDGVLFVTREGTTKKRQLRRGIEMLDKSSIVGVVVNDCHRADQDNYYDHYTRQLKTPERQIAAVSV